MIKKDTLLLIGSALVCTLLQVHVVFGAVAAPIVSKQGYGLGARLQQGGDAVVGSWNKTHFDFTFMYEGDSSALKAFRLYEKTPSASSFSQVVEFGSLLDVTGSHAAVSGTWSLNRLNSTWIVSKRNTALLTNEPVPLYELTSAFAPGIHSFYVTAVDSYGSESAPSQTFNLTILGPIQILEPTANAVLPLQPTLRWNVVLPWPDNQVLYLVNIYDGTKTVWSKTFISKTGELVYEGPSLDPAATYTLHVEGRWTSDTLKPLQTYFAGSQDSVFHVSETPPVPQIVPPPTPTPSAAPVVCTQDTKACSDGSFVGRIAPSCEFQACPVAKTVSPKPTVLPIVPKTTPPVKPVIEKPVLLPPPANSQKIEEKPKTQEHVSTTAPEVRNENQELPRGFFARMLKRLLSIFGLK